MTIFAEQNDSFQQKRDRTVQTGRHTTATDYFGP